MKVHPVHFQHHSLCSLTWYGRCSKFDADETYIVVWQGQSCLRITSPFNEVGPLVDIDLMLADVKHDWDSDAEQHLIIVSPSCGLHRHNAHLGDINYNVLLSRNGALAVSDDTLSIPSVPQKDNVNDAAPEFWIFLVEGNGSAVHSIFKRMGEAGAIRLDPFAVLEMGQKIGSGATACVYCARYCHAGGVKRSRCKNTVAVKVLKPNPDCATAPEELDAFRHEIALNVQAGQHPNIIRFLGVYCLEYQDKSMSTDAGLISRWALVSEYMDGGNLSGAVSNRRFKEPRAHQVMADLLSALAHTHRCGIVHRDVKADNLLLTKHGKAVLADFGIAALISDAEAMCQSCGTPGYVAPEVIGRKPHGVKVDSFSAGVTLYFMLCGKLPFTGSSTISVLTRTMKDEVSFESHPEFSKVSGRCKDFIHKLLLKDPCSRPTAEQAAFQMWGSTEYLECGRHTWTSNAVDGRSSSSMSEASAHNQFMAFDHYDPHAHSSSIPNCERERHTEKDNSDPASDMAKCRSEQSESRICEKQAFRLETPNGERIIAPPVKDKSSSAQPSSKAYGGPDPGLMRGNAGRLLQALHSANAANPPQTQIETQGGKSVSGSALMVVPPALRPEHPRPQTRSLWALLSRGRNRKNDN